MHGPSKRHAKDPNAILIWAAVVLIVIGLSRLISWLFSGTRTH